MAILNNDWAEVISEEFEQPYYLRLRELLKEEYENGTVYPDMYDIFAALHLTPYHQVRAVILGQDPYHGPGQAHGLSFSVNPGVAVPPSLQNIYKELRDDLGCPIPNHGHLVSWAEQGVLMLNTALTVRAHSANSHRGIGWETFTDKIISVLSQREQPIVFILWGKNAQEKQALIDKHHFIITSPHPSPFAARKGFFGSRPFSRANEMLVGAGSEPIDWCIPSI